MFGLCFCLSRIVVRGALAIAGTLVLMACLGSALQAQAVKPAPATPIDVKKAELGGAPWCRQEHSSADEQSRVRHQDSLNQIIQHQKPLITKKSYWEPLHPGSYSHRVFLKEMTNPPEACGARTQSKVAKNKTTRTVKQEAEQKQVAKGNRDSAVTRVASERP
jgi:hypothetical protein